MMSVGLATKQYDNPMNWKHLISLLSASILQYIRPLTDPGKLLKHKKGGFCRLLRSRHFEKSREHYVESTYQHGESVRRYSKYQGDLTCISGHSELRYLCSTVSFPMSNIVACLFHKNFKTTKATIVLDSDITIMEDFETPCFHL